MAARIAIIAILAAILFPVFAKAREKARQSSCLSNVRQIMTAVLSYTQDYDELLPKCWTVVGTLNYEHPWWYEACEPYMKNSQIMLCPSDKATSPGDGMNYIHMGSYGTAVPLGNVQRPSELLFCVDQYREHSTCVYASESAANPQLHCGGETAGGSGRRSRVRGAAQVGGTCVVTPAQ